MEVPTYSPEQRRSMVGIHPYMSPQTVDGLTDEQFGMTFDPELRRQNPDRIGKRFNPFRPPEFADTAANLIGRGIRGAGSGLNKAHTSGYLGAGLTGAGLGAIGGYGLYKFLTRGKNQGNDKEVASMVGPKMSALLGAALLGGTALANHNFQTKYASSDSLVNQIHHSGLPYKEKQEIISAIRKLSHQEQDRLSRTTRGVVGAALGAAVARYLRSKGLLPMIAGGIIGGALGWGSFSTPRRPAQPLYISKY